jgi:hypothetical protein
MTTALRSTAQTSPSRHLKAVGVIGRRAGRTVSIVRTASGTAGTVDLPVRIPAASRPPKPSVPPPVAFLTASKVPADLDAMAGWTAADFETMRILDETTRPLPVEVVDAAWLDATTELAYFELDTKLATQVAYELAAGGESR